MEDDHTYWCESLRDGEINVVTGGDFHGALAEGKAVQFYCMDYYTLKPWAQTNFPEAEVWYTERNGDSIAMLIPKGTRPERFPSVALDYIAFEWIDPDKDFGTGVVPGKRKRKTL